MTQIKKWNNKNKDNISGLDASNNQTWAPSIFLKDHFYLNKNQLDPEYRHNDQCDQA